MLQTKDLAKDIPGVTLNWTVARAVGPINQITEKAQALGDVRIAEPGAEKKLDAALQAKITSGKLIPDTETTVKVEVGRPAFVAGEKGRAGREGAGDLQGDRPRTRAHADDRRRHRRGLRGALGQGNGGRELRPRGLRLPRARRVHRGRLDRAAAVPG